MTNQPKLILVTGATGQQGGAVAHRLIRQGQKIRALTRHPEKASELVAAGAELVTGDLTDPGSLETALRGMQGVFAMSTPFETGIAAEVRQGVSMADAAKKAGVEHYVYTSVIGADRNTGIPHFESKWKVEQHIRRTGLPATILRPVFFMENLGSPWMLPALLEGTLSLPLHPATKLPMIALKDIAEFAAAAFIRPEEFIGQTVELAGDELTMPEVALHVSEAMGRPVTFRQVPDDQIDKAYGHDMATMYRWYNQMSYSVNIPALRARFGIPLTPFVEWIRHTDSIVPR